MGFSTIGMALGVGAAVLASSVAGVAINDNKELENKNKQLVVEVENAKENKVLQDAIISNLTAEKETLNLALIDKQNLIDERDLQINGLSSENAVIRKEIEELENERSDMYEQLRNLVEEREILINLNNKDQRQIETLNVQISDLTVALNEKDAEITRLTESYNNTLNQIETLTVERDNLQEQTVSLQNQINELLQQTDGWLISLDTSWYDVGLNFTKNGPDGVVIPFTYSFNAIENDFNLYLSGHEGSYIKYVMNCDRIAEIDHVWKNDLYSVSLNDLSSTFPIVSTPFEFANSECVIQPMYNGGEYSEDLISDTNSYNMLCKVNFEFNENNEIEHTTLYIDIVPVETQE